MTVPVDDDGRPVGWPLGPLARAAIPDTVKPHKWTAELLAFYLAEPDEFAVEAAMHRGWCTDTEADRWAIAGLCLMPWLIWPEWLTAGLHPIDRLYPLDTWWRPAWEWARAGDAQPVHVVHGEVAA